MTLTNDMLGHIELEKKGRDLYRGTVDDHGFGRVFGGQVAGQALMAAGATVEGRDCHSLHGYFLRPGNAEMPIFYEVNRIRDGGSFATRRVDASQNGKVLFTVTASFQPFQKGLEHQAEMPTVPGPEELPTEQELLERCRAECPDVDDRLLQMVHGPTAVEIRRVEDYSYFRPRKMPPKRHIWYRSQQALGEELLKHQSLLTHVSDIGLLATSCLPHGKSGMTSLKMASIDHAMWFHRPFNFHNWVLIAIDSTVTAGTRGHSRASIFTQDGQLIASACQEGLIRDTAP